MRNTFFFKERLKIIFYIVGTYLYLSVKMSDSVLVLVNFEIIQIKRLSWLLYRKNIITLENILHFWEPQNKNTHIINIEHVQSVFQRYLANTFGINTTEINYLDWEVRLGLTTRINKSNFSYFFSCYSFISRITKQTTSISSKFLQSPVLYMFVINYAEHN